MEINSVHDKYFKKMMGNKEIAKEFFKAHLPSHILSQTNLDTLKLRSESYIDPHLKKLLTDLIFSIDFNNQPGYLYFLIEHKSRGNKWVPLKLYHYVGSIMQHHLDNVDKNQLPVVLPIVFYHGKKRYRYSTDLFDLFGKNRSLAESFLLKPFQLIDLSIIPDDEIKQHGLSAPMEFIMKHIFARDLLVIVKTLAQLLAPLERQGYEDYIIATTKYAFTTGQVSNPDHFISEIAQKLSPKTGEVFMTLAEQLILRGREEGKVEGKVEGKIEGKIEGKVEAAHEMALKMLAERVDLAFISRITGLSKQELLQMQKELIITE